MGKQVDFFLGANTAKGFGGFFDELCRPAQIDRLYVIKGGPGTGKSNIMKSAVKAVSDKSALTEIVHCASDPGSLDAVICKDLSFAIADGTPPHTIEPRYPGAFESVINICDFWDEKKLISHRNEIIAANEAISACHSRCQNYLQAAYSVLKDNYNISLKYTNTAKISKFVKTLIQKEFPRRVSSDSGEHKRLLSAVTPEGIVFYSDTVKKLCDKIYLIRDDYGAASDLILKEIRKYALESGKEFYSCWCPLSPKEKLEHLFFPEIGLGIMTANRFIEPADGDYRVIKYTRFSNLTALKSKKQRLNFNRKVASELLLEAVSSLKTAKQIHDTLESYYIGAMDFSRVNEKTVILLDNLAAKE